LLDKLLTFSHILPILRGLFWGSSTERTGGGTGNSREFPIFGVIHRDFFGGWEESAALYIWGQKVKVLDVFSSKMRILLKNIFWARWGLGLMWGCEGVGIVGA
jgi:hypothetical protein